VAAFLFAIARRLAIDLWRRPSSRPFESEPQPASDPDREFDHVLLQVVVRDALDSLSGSFVTTSTGPVTVRWETAADLGRYPNLGVTLEPDNGSPPRQGPKVLAEP